jgi:DNA-directed RNA polymerase specialized sigma24 family protein
VNPTSTPSGLDIFEGERPRLTGLAYRITGSLADAEDVVEEMWIRWATRDAATVDNPAGWLTTVTSRLARSARTSESLSFSATCSANPTRPSPRASERGSRRAAARLARSQAPNCRRRAVRQLLKGSWRLFALRTLSSPDDRPPARLLEINSSPSLVLDTSEGPIVITGEAVRGQITSIWVRLNPDKTAALENPPPIV